MKHLFLITLATGVLASGTLLLAQDDREKAPGKSDGPAQVQAAAPQKGSDVTTAKVKEYTPGKKIELDVENAPDKSFDLTDKNTTVNVAANVKTGDTVQVMERTGADGKKMVEITPASAPAKR
jgi:hypothetical protein